MTHQRGFSVTELLVALLSSSLLILIVMNQYISVKQHYRHLQKKMEASLDLQLIEDLVRTMVRQAGFTPCMSIDHLIVRDMRDPLHKLRAIDLNADKLGHGFRVSHMRDHYNILTQQQSLTDWVSTRDVDLTRLRPVLIADCHHAEVHTLRAVRKRPDHLEVSLMKPLHYTYEPPIFIGEWVEEHVFIRSGTLFYQLSHAEAISDAVSHLSVSLTRNLLQVQLWLPGNQSMAIDVAMRTV